MDRPRNKPSLIEVVDVSKVLDNTGHIKPELMTILSFGSEASDIWANQGDAVRAHLETCVQCARELEDESDTQLAS